MDLIKLIVYLVLFVATLQIILLYLVYRLKNAVVCCLSHYQSIATHQNSEELEKQQTQQDYNNLVKMFYNTEQPSKHSDYQVMDFDNTINMLLTEQEKQGSMDNF